MYSHNCMTDPTYGVKGIFRNGQIDCMFQACIDCAKVGLKEFERDYARDDWSYDLRAHIGGQFVIITPKPTVVTYFDRDALEMIDRIDCDEKSHGCGQMSDGSCLCDCHLCNCGCGEFENFCEDHA